MTRLGLLLGKDLRRLARSPLLLAALVVYPLLVALLVGVVVRYAGERPRVALVDRAGLPQTIVLGGRELRPAAAVRAGERGRPRPPEPRPRRAGARDRPGARGADRARGLHRPSARPAREPAGSELRTSSGALGARVTEKMRALVYGINLELQQAYIDANLGYVKLLQEGGSGQVGRSRLTVLGLRRAEQQLRGLARSPDPKVAGPAAELARFVGQVNGAVGQVGEFLRRRRTRSSSRRMPARAGRGCSPRRCRHTRSRSRSPSWRSFSAPRPSRPSGRS